MSGNPYHKTALNLIREAVIELEDVSVRTFANVEDAANCGLLFGQLSAGMMMLERSDLPEKHREEVVEALCEIRDSSSVGDVKKRFSERSLLGISGKNKVIDFLKTEGDFSSNKGLALLGESDPSVILEAASADDVVRMTIFNVMSYEGVDPYLRRKLLKVFASE